MQHKNFEIISDYNSTLHYFSSKKKLIVMLVKLSNIARETLPMDDKRKHVLIELKLKANNSLFFY